MDDLKARYADNDGAAGVVRCRILCERGIRAFCHERAVVQIKVMLAGIFFHPYTEFTRKVVNWILRYL